MALSRVHTFVSGATLSAAQLNNEYDNILDSLNGTATTAEIVLKSATAAPTLTVDQQTVGQPIVRYKFGGVEKAKVNADGQFESVLTTGTAPLVVASTTKVANLNAALLDGVAKTGFYQVDQGGDTTLENGTNDPIVAIKGGAGGTVAGVEINFNDVERWRIKADAGGLLVERYNGATWDLATEFKGTPDSTSPATRAYVDAKLTTLSFGAFYEGEPTTAAKQSRYVVPQDIESAQITRVQYVVGTAGTGTTEITLERFNSAGASQGSVAVSIGASVVGGQTYVDDIADFALAAGDSLVWTVTNDAGTHSDISIWAQGEQEII